MLSSNFNALRDLHDCANDLLRSTRTQQAFVHDRHEKWVSEFSEGILRMLDVCSTTRDVLLPVKQHLQELQSALRRRSFGKPSLVNKIVAYNITRKQMKKEMFKCLGALKAMKNNCIPSPLSGIDQNLMVVVNVLREVRVITITIVESILAFISMSRPNPKSNRRFFVSKFMQASQVGSALEENDMSAMEMVDAALYALHDRNLSEKPEAVRFQSAAKQLEALEISIEGLEVELDCMFRRLIQTRVSLLNIVNH